MNTDRRHVGLEFGENVGTFLPFLKSLVVLKVIVKFPFAFLSLTAFATKTPSGVQNSKMKFIVNPSILRAEFLFISSLRALVRSCNLIVPSSESLFSSMSFLLFKTSLTKTFLIKGFWGGSGHLFSSQQKPGEWVSLRTKNYSTKLPLRRGAQT